MALWPEIAEAFLYLNISRGAEDMLIILINQELYGGLII
jgi:hypothetical protein